MMIDYLDKQKVMAMLFDKAMDSSRLDEPIFYHQIRRDSFEKARLAVSDMPPDNMWISFDDKFPQKGSHICVFEKGGKTLSGNCAIALYGRDGKLYIYDDLCGFSNIKERYSHWFYIPERLPEENKNG